jgi:hypothetical protein
VLSDQLGVRTWPAVGLGGGMLGSTIISGSAAQKEDSLQSKRCQVANYEHQGSDEDKLKNVVSTLSGRCIEPAVYAQLIIWHFNLLIGCLIFFSFVLSRLYNVCMYSICLDWITRQAWSKTGPCDF